MKFEQLVQVRFHGNMDGSSLAHAIQVPLGPLRLSVQFRQ